jgi:hypothetical protein
MALYVARKPKVRLNADVLRLRAFPSVGEPGVSPGDEVKWDTVLGQYASRRRLRFVRVESSGDGISATVLVGEGQNVKRGEVLAYYSYLFGLGFNEYTSPCDGEVAGIRQDTATIAIKEAPVPLRSNMPGRVESTDDALGIFVRSRGDLVFGTLGAGYGRSGTLEVRNPGQALSLDLSVKDTGKVIVFPGQVTQELLEACMKLRVAGAIAGSVQSRVLQWYRDLVEKLDWDEFLARYWTRELREKDASAPPPMEISPALVVTEGFGDIPMSDDAFELLSRHEGERAFLDGVGAFRSKAAGGIESVPCVFIPMSGGETTEAGKYLECLKEGDRVTVLGIVEPLVEGTILELNEEGVPLQTGLSVPGAKVQTRDGRVFWAPVFNIEKAD